MQGVLRVIYLSEVIYYKQFNKQRKFSHNNLCYDFYLLTRINISEIYPAKKYIKLGL